jgi:hypothetical protein
LLPPTARSKACVTGLSTFFSRRQKRKT